MSVVSLIVVVIFIATVVVVVVVVVAVSFQSATLMMSSTKRAQTRWVFEFQRELNLLKFTWSLLMCQCNDGVEQS